MLDQALIKQLADVAPVRPILPQKPEANVSNLKAQEQVTRRWVATPSYDTPFERLLEPDYWAPMSSSMLPDDIIIVHPESRAYFAELIVLEVAGKAVRVFPLRKVDLPDAVSPKPAEGLSVRYRGPIHQYTVMRGNEVVRTGFRTSKEAEAASLTITSNE